MPETGYAVIATRCREFVTPPASPSPDYHVRLSFTRRNVRVRSLCKLGRHDRTDTDGLGCVCMTKKEGGIAIAMSGCVCSYAARTCFQDKSVSWPGRVSLSR